MPKSSKILFFKISSWFNNTETKSGTQMLYGYYYSNEEKRFCSFKMRPFGILYLLYLWRCQNTKIERLYINYRLGPSLRIGLDLG